MSTFRERLDEADRFFEGRGRVHQTTNRICALLTTHGIPYAIIGGMAMNAHGYVRVTTDLDLLTTEEALGEIHEKIVGHGFEPHEPGARRRLRDMATGVRIDLITTGRYPGDGKPKAVIFPDPRSCSVEIDGHNVIRLERLVELKLAAGASPSRIHDLADAQVLTQVLNLPRTLGDQLDPSVRDEYYRLWDASQNVSWDPSAE
jgi:hypothetical protein